MNHLLIYGTGKYADIIYWLAHDVLQLQVAAFVLDQKYITTNMYLNRPVISIEQVAEHYSPDNYDITIGFIGSNMFTQRREKYELCTRMGYHIPNLIHPSSVIASNVQMGDGNIIFECVTMGPFCDIGVGNIFWNGANIAHHAKIGDFCNFAPGTSLSGISTIGNHCFLGVNATTKNYIKMADYTLAGAGAYVSHDTNSYDVIVPARSITLEGKRSTDFM